NVPSLEQTYHGVEATVNRRFSDGLTLFGGVTFGRNRATSAEAVGGNPNGYINADGYDLLDSPVILNVSGIYQLPWQLNISGHLGYFTGQPLQRLYTVTRTIAPTLRQVSQEVALLPAGDERKPNQTLLDVRLGRSFRLGNGLSVEPLFEVYNLLN